MTTPYLAEPPGRPRTRPAADGSDEVGGALAALPGERPALGAPGQHAAAEGSQSGVLARVPAASTDRNGAAPSGHQADGRVAQAMNGPADPMSVIFDALLGRAPVAFALHDTAGRYVRVNDLLARLNGRSAAEHIGRTMPELLGDIGHEMEALLARVVRTGDPVVDLKVSVATGGSEPPQTWKASWYPATDSRGALFGVVFVATDATRHADVEVELTRLQARYRTLVEAAAVDSWHAGSDGGLDMDIPRWRMTTGQRRPDVAGLGWLDAVHPDDREAVRGLWREAVEAGESFDAEFRVVAADGTDRVMHARAVALRDSVGGEWVGAVRDVTEVRTAETMRAALANRAQAALDRGDQLHQITAELSRAVTVDDVIAIVLDAGEHVLGAAGRGVALVDPKTDRLRFRALSGYSAAYAHRWSEIGLGAVHPAAETVRGGRPLYLSGREELSSRWPVPDLISSLEAVDEHAWAMLPLATTEAPFGVLAFGFRAPRPFSAEDRTFLGALADQCAQALERATLFERVFAEAAASRRSDDAARNAELAAELAESRLDALAKITAAVAKVAEPERALRRLAEAMVADVADVCEIYLVSTTPSATTPSATTPSARTTSATTPSAVARGATAPGTAVVDPEAAPRVGVTADLAAADPAAVEAAGVAVDARRAAFAVRAGLTQRPVPGEAAGPHPAEGALGQAARGEGGVSSVEQAWWLTPEQLRWLRHIGAHTLAAVPVVRGGAVAAVAVFTATGDRPPFTTADLTFLNEVAAHAAVVVQPAEPERDRWSTALSVQRSLLPREVVAPPGVEVAAHYLPGSGEAEVGGDWYDVIDLGAGRVALVVGDVSGRGVQAAAVMGQIRAAARTCARLDLPPAEVLTHLDDLVASTDEWQLATCLYAVVEAHTGLLTLASAGHPSPLVVAPDGLVSRLYMAVGAPLGAGANDVKEYVVRLGRGATLALFTDGLVVRRGRDVDVGVSDLAASLSFAAGAWGPRGHHRVVQRSDGSHDLAGVMSRQVQETVTGLGRNGALADDAVLLLASLPVDSRAGAQVDVPVADGAAGLAQARAVARAALESWSLDADVVDAVVTVLSELVANAIQHGQLPMSARIRQAISQIVVEVADAGGRMPRRRHADVDDETGRGLELVSSFVSRWGSRSAGDGKIVWAEVAVSRR